MFASRSPTPTTARHHAWSTASRRARRVVAASSGLPKLYIPADGMGGESPELKAAKTLRRLFTFVAIRIVQGHIEGAGNGAHFTRA